MNIFGFRPFKGRFNLGNSDDIPTNTDGTLIGAVKQINTTKMSGNVEVIATNDTPATDIGTSGKQFTLNADIDNYKMITVICGIDGNAPENFSFTVPVDVLKAVGKTVCYNFQANSLNYGAIVRYDDDTHLTFYAAPASVNTFLSKIYGIK